MHTTRIRPLASTTVQPNTLADVSRVHHRTAERIQALAAWQIQVVNAAAAVGAERVPYQTLLQRAREIVLRGATYTVDRGDCSITYGASLIDDGGFVPLYRTAKTVDLS